MATATAQPGREAALATLTRMLRVMFPHDRFPDGPYERTAQAILQAATEDPRSGALLRQGLVDLDAAGAPLTERPDDEALEALRAMSATPFFALVRATAVVTLYNDHEVWALLGYPGPCPDRAGYVARGYDDLDWLPDPRIEEAG